MKKAVQQLLITVLQEIGVTDMVPEVEISGSAVHGEYTTNIAMRLAKILKKSPMDIGLSVKEAISQKLLAVSQNGVDQSSDQSDHKISSQDSEYSVLQDIESVEVVAPGFINIKIFESKLSSQLVEVLKQGEGYGKAKSESKIGNRKSINAEQLSIKRIMVEFAHPNTHKAFHIGHLRNITTGETIVRLLESQGVKVIRANYQGDVGMHIAKCLYGIKHQSELLPELQTFAEIQTKSIPEKVAYLGKVYAAGSQAYEHAKEHLAETASLKEGENSKSSAKLDIEIINKQIYAKDDAIYPLYLETRKWSLDYFDSIYKRVGSHFDRLYFESETYQTGKNYVMEGLEKGIFEKSQGAIIFPGKKFGLHDRVFITSEGNATYEAKDMGLGRLQFDEYNPELIIHCVGPEQASYFQVMFEALSHLFPDTQGREKHLVYGWVKLKQGKMSSRMGNVILGEWLLDEAEKRITDILLNSQTKGIEINQNSSNGKAEISDISKKAAVAAVKYAFLKVSTTQELAFDFDESISFDGDSGPYLLYTYARCKSVIRKAGKAAISCSQLDVSQNKIKAYSQKLIANNDKLNPEEHAVARLIFLFPDIVKGAAENYSPNILCTYLFDLAQAFNLFYAKNKILAISSQPLAISENSNQSSSQQPLVDSSSQFRLTLTAATAQVLKNGLYLLGIETVERM
jgi:arginyl-tRNA synthetase